MATKRKLSEFDVSDACSTEVATIHGIMTNVSPMKAGKRAKFFEAKVTDGHKHMRVVGFQPQLQTKLAEYERKLEPVALTNCEVKQARQSEELEVMLKSSTTVEGSPKKFSVSNISLIAATEITLDQLESKNTFEKVTVNVKAIHLDEPVKVSGGLQKQEVTVADSHSVARLTLWETDVGRLSENKSYRLSDVVVRTYQQYKYLSMPKHGATITEIDDIGEVKDDVSDGSTTVYGAEVLGVPLLESYPACFGCKSKVAPTTSNFGICTKCQMPQRIDRCSQQWHAKLVVSSGTDYLTLQAFGSNVTDIAQDYDVTHDALMSAQPFTLTYDNNVITSIQRSV